MPDDMNDDTSTLDAATLRAVRLVVDDDVRHMANDCIADAKAVYTWRTVDAELAMLSYDSATDLELAGVRSNTTTRTLSFEFTDLAIEFDAVAESATAVTVDGIAGPAQPVAVTVQHASGATVEAVVADGGRFTARGVPTGAVRIVVSFAQRSSPAIVVTEWTSV